MAKIYDRCWLVFSSKNNEAELIHPYLVEIQDFDDYIEITTDIVIEEIHRGWLGDITFHFVGEDITEPWVKREAKWYFKLENVLCSMVSFDKNEGECVHWTYKFLKY